MGDDPWHALEVSTRSPERRREVRLLCEEGVAVLPDPYSDHIEIFRRTEGSPSRPRPSPSYGRPPPSCHSCGSPPRLFEHLDGGPPPRSSAVEGAAAVRAITDLRSLMGVPG